jgi:hypothetical protein
MNTKLFLALSVMAALPLVAACELSAAIPVQRSYGLSGFTAIQVGDGCSCLVTRADEYSVTAEFDPDIADHIQVGVVGSTLVVKYAPSIWLLGFKAFRIMSMRRTIAVSMPGLESFSIYGGGEASLVGFTAGSAVLKAGGGSPLAIADCEMDAAEISAAGGSRITMSNSRLRESSVKTGGGSRLSLEVSSSLGAAREISSWGGGGLYSDESSSVLSCESLVLSGGSGAQLYHCASVTVKASGGSRIVCDADTLVTIRELSGGSTVTRR